MPQREALPAGRPGQPVVSGQIRARSLRDILAIAEPAAAGAGVTRLAELTGLDGFGFPVFQAVRPWSLSLATAMGRGSTRRAAIASALLEAIETDIAERISPTGAMRPLSAMGDAALATWHAAPRDEVAIRLDPAVPRHWLDGVTLAGGEFCAVPFDLVSQDLSAAALPDSFTSTVGLATGGNETEAIASAIGELLEHDLDADWRRASASERRLCEIDLASVTDDAVKAALARIASVGCATRLWSTGHDHGIAAFLCFITDTPQSSTRLPPVYGGGCHPDRTVAALRAIFEAGQGRAAMIAGARDDMAPHYYADASKKLVELALSCLSFGAGPLAWQSVPTTPGVDAAQALELVANVARSRSPLPLIVVPLPGAPQGLSVVKVVAPGLRLCERLGIAPPPAPRPPYVQGKPRHGRRVLFVGPSLWSDVVPDTIERRPPAVAGDFAALLADPPEMVGLIDGCFETGPAVWHKEMLELVAAGVAVFGAASLGAIRAAELEAYGVRGVGRIFAAYRDAAVMRDDAVMQVHAPAELGYRPMSLALVDAEQALATADIPPAERRMLLRIARTCSFRTRSWATILASYRSRTGRAASIEPEALDAVPSLKRADALHLVDMLLGPVPASTPRLRPPLTSYHANLLARIAPRQR